MTTSTTSPNTDIVFSPAVKQRQAKYGSRDLIERWEQRGGFREDRDEQLRFAFSARNSFYLGTASADGQPYIQHRGGPTGFVKWLGNHLPGADRSPTATPVGRTVAWAEYAGNKQYVSYGNLDDNPRATIFLMDYVNRHRIKVWGRAEVVEPGDPDDKTGCLPPTADIFAAVTDPDYTSAPDRAILFHIDAWDGNCPKHIPVLIPAETVEEAVSALQARIAELEAQLEV